MTIASDSVDHELLDNPRRWDVKFIRNFMISFGLVSSVFDYATFGILLYILRATPEQFRTAWFLESLMTELFIALVIRTRRPFFQSRPGKYLFWSTLAVALVSFVLPYTPVSSLLGFAPLPLSYMVTVVGIVALYITASEVTKALFYRRLGAGA